MVLFRGGAGGSRRGRMAMLVVSFALETPHAQAHGRDFTDGRWVCKIGAALAASAGHRPVSLVSGLEGNCGFMNTSGFWAGPYADVQWSFGPRMARISLGPMLGWNALGVDGGYLLAHDDGRMRHGFTVRPFITLGFGAFYYRFGSLFEPREYLHDFGVLFEWPIYLQKLRPVSINAPNR